MTRALCIVLDSVGCGHAPDAEAFGDAGADTLGHLFERVPGFALPALSSLGLHDILRDLHVDFPLPSPLLLPGAAHAHLTERSPGKDTTTGHWELMGAPLDAALETFECFPDDLVADLEKLAGRSFLGNEAASGTEIIARLGEEHVRSGKPILYTSADSVMQIAAHESPDIFGLDRLLQLCAAARQLLDEKGIRIGRVIARPFIGSSADDFQRTPNRHDESLLPPPTVLNRLEATGVTTIGVGKISDIFAGSGITESHPTKSNTDGMATLERLWAEPREEPHLVFANLVDFDMLYGHRRDPEGYATALIEFDRWLGGFLGRFEPPDLLIITADHGNDPYHPGTDHTRERVPLLTLHAPENEVTHSDLGTVARLIAHHFGVA